MKELPKTSDAGEERMRSSGRQMPKERGAEEVQSIKEKNVSFPDRQHAEEISPISQEAERVHCARRSIRDLQVRGNKWGIYNSSLLVGEFSFQKSFEGVLPKGENLKEYIENRFSERNGELVGIEVGGSGSNVFGEFSDGFFSHSVGISLSDERDPTLKQMDQQRNHKLIIGDLLETTTKQRVLDWLGGRKVDVIFERMYCGIDALPDAPFYMAEQVGFYYSLLSEDGVLFAEVPDAFKGSFSHRDLVNPWVQKMCEQYPSLEIQTSDDGFIIKVQKLSGSPDELPLLSAKEFVHAEQQAKRIYQERIANLVSE